MDRRPALAAALLALALAACTGGNTTPQGVAGDLAGAAGAPAVELPVPPGLGFDPCVLGSADAVGEALGRTTDAPRASGSVIRVPAEQGTVPAGACTFVASGDTGPEPDRVEIRVAVERTDVVFDRLAFRLERQDGLGAPALWQADAGTIWLHPPGRIVSVQVIRRTAQVDHDSVTALAAAVVARSDATKGTRNG